MFSAAAPSMEARTVMGAPGGSRDFRGPSFNGDQIFLTGTLCGSPSYRRDRGTFLCRSNRKSSFSDEV